MHIVLGSIICVLGGVGVGSFLLPLRYSRNWQWENSWLIAAFFMYVVFPLATLSLLVPRFPEIYALTPGRDLWMIYFLGLIQGTGSLVFTYGTRLMGLSLGYALMIGCIALVGLLVPLLGAHADRLTKLDGLTLLAGCGILLVGIAGSGRAGLEREKLKVTAAGGNDQNKISIPLAALVVLWAGIANAMFYFTFEFQKSMKSMAIEQFHVPAYAWGFLNTVPFFLGMFTINLFLTGGKMIKDGALTRYWSAPQLKREYLLAVTVGVVWYLGQGIGYTAAQAVLGPLGVAVGGALFMGTIMAVSNLLGVYTGEWKGAPPKTMRKLYIALVLLIVAMSIVALGNYFQQTVIDAG